ncbi:MAG: histidinol-phosphate transaminase [Acidimicrobiales bacterium]
MSPARLRADLALMEGYHSPQVQTRVRLNTNESPYPPPPGLVANLTRRIESVAFNRYPDRQAMALRSAVGESHGVGPDQVLVTKGSNEALQALCLAFGGAGRRAAVFEPTYALHSHIARLTGMTVCVGGRTPDGLTDETEVTRILTESAPDVVFVCSPNNPTGGAENPSLVVRIAAEAPGLVVVDEAYAQFSPTSALGLVQPGSPVAVTRTFSKTWAMAGARLGYLVGPPEIVAGTESVLLPYHLDAMSQAAGLVAMEMADELEARVAEVVAERDRISTVLASMGVRVWPSDANFVLFATAFPAFRVWTGLVDRSVLVRDCSGWPGLGNALRVTVGTPWENDAFLEAMIAVMNDEGIDATAAEGAAIGGSITVAAADPRASGSSIGAGVAQ